MYCKCSFCYLFGPFGLYQAIIWLLGAKIVMILLQCCHLLGFWISGSVESLLTVSIQFNCFIARPTGFTYGMARNKNSLNNTWTYPPFGDNNKRVWHMTDQTLENRSVNSFNRYNLMKNLIDQCHSWWVIRNVYQCCDFTVIFWGGTLGGGGGGMVLLILYMNM